MSTVHCEKCGADLRTEYDESGTGNHVDSTFSFEFAWVCDDCFDTILNEYESDLEELADIC